MKKFPKVIYVDRQNEGTDGEYFEVNTSLEFLPDEEGQIAIYELKEVKNLMIKKELK